MDAERLNDISETIIGCAIEVHRQIGPGLLESAYRKCLAYELRLKGLKVEEEVPVPLVYKDVRLDCGYRMDLRVEGAVVVELKSVDVIHPINLAQLKSHLVVAGHPLGLLINFRTKLLIDGIRRVVNNFPDIKHQDRHSDVRLQSKD
jgi:GxxExxY protein